MNSTAEILKLNEALRRAIPVSRMTDYGMLKADVEEIHAAAADGMDWVEALVSLTERDEASAARAATEGDAATAAGLWHRAAMGLVFAQMVDNFDTPRKRQLYRRMTGNFQAFAKNSAVPVEKIAVPFQGTHMFSWHFRSSRRSEGAVVVFGGLSGWATAYRSAAEALSAAGLDCLLVDVPGQGETRLESALYGVSAIAGLSRFFDYLEGESITRLGVWGNSFGGLFSALVAATDKRVAACCINGAPPRCEPPPFRTPSEQLAALFGKSDLEGLDREMQVLTFDPAVAPIKCPALILEGGADPLAAPNSQDIFLSRNTDVRSRKLTWEDGEHTIYNHAAERNRLVSEWFRDCLL